MPLVLGLGAPEPCSLTPAASKASDCFSAQLLAEQTLLLPPTPLTPAIGACSWALLMVCL